MKLPTIHYIRAGKFKSDTNKDKYQHHDTCEEQSKCQYQENMKQKTRSADNRLAIETFIKCLEQSVFFIRMKNFNSRKSLARRTYFEVFGHGLGALVQ